MVDQIMKESSCKSDVMSLYCQEVLKLEGKFEGIELKHIPRKLNKIADSLAKMVSGREAIPFGVFAGRAQDDEANVASKKMGAVTTAGAGPRWCQRTSPPVTTTSPPPLSPWMARAPAATAVVGRRPSFPR